MSSEVALRNQPAQPRAAAGRNTSLAPKSITGVLVGEKRGLVARGIHPEAAAVVLLLWAKSFSTSVPDHKPSRPARARLGGKTEQGT